MYGEKNLPKEFSKLLVNTNKYILDIHVPVLLLTSYAFKLIARCEILGSQNSSKVENLI